MGQTTHYNGVKIDPGPASTAMRRCDSVCAAHGLRGAGGQSAEHEQRDYKE